MSKKQIFAAGITGTMIGSAILLRAGTDANGDGFLEFVNGEVITADDINDNFIRTSDHVVKYETAVQVTSDFKVGLGGSPTNDESLYIFQDETGIGSHLNLRLEKAEGNDMVQLTDGADFDFSFGLDATDNMAYIGISSYPELMVLKGGKIGLGTTNPAAKLDIIGSNTGSIRLADTESDSTNKLGRLVGRPYINAQTDFLAFDIRGLNGVNSVYYGGGSSLLNTVTEHVFFTAANTTTLVGTERIRITSSGNIGINYSSPFSKLWIKGPSANSAVFDDASTTATAVIAGDGANVRLQLGTGDSAMGPYGGWIQSSFDNGGSEGTEPLMLNPVGGNVGVATTTPTEQLDVSGSIRAAGVRKMRLTRTMSTTAAGTYVNIGTITREASLPIYAKIKIWTHHSDALTFNEFELSDVYYAGTTTDWVEVAPTSVHSWANDGRKVITVDAMLASSGASLELRIRRTEASTGAGTIQVELETNSTFSASTIEGTGATVASGYLGQAGWFFPSTANRFEATTEGLYITPAGNVGIATTSPSYKLDVNGSLRAYGITDASDERLKTNIEPLQNASSAIACLKGVTYQWNDEVAEQHGFSRDIQVGLIAQDVEACMPEVVETDNDGYKSIAYSRLVVPLIETAKQQQAENAALKREVGTQKKEIADLKARLERLEKVLR